MILILVLCLLFAAVIATAVMRPLVQARNQEVFSRAHEGFTDESELRAVVELRDALLRKLVYGSSTVAGVAEMSAESTFDALVSVCMRLQRADLPFLPDGIGREERPVAPGTGAGTARGGATPIRGAVLGLFLCLAGLSLGRPQRAQAQDEFRSPPPVQHEGLWLPQLNQFVLSPDHGRLRVYYIGMFENVTGATEARIGLPLPEGFQDLKFLDMPKAVLAETAQNRIAALTMPVAPGANRVRVEFVLEAPLGKATWANSSFPSIPGATIILMPEYEGFLRRTLEKVSPDVNLWPARVTGLPQGFESARVQDEPDPRHPNFELLRQAPPQFVRRLMRLTRESVPFPRFEVVGLVPSRVPLYVLTSLVGALLFGVAVFTIARTSSPATPAAKKT